MQPYYLKYHSEYKVFQNIVNTIKSIRLSKIEESYLRHFVYHRHSSAYDIEPNKKMQDEKGHVKLNTNKYRRAKIIVRKLHKSKLIKPDKEKEKNLHKKKFYSLTDIGLFYIIRLTTFLSIDIQVMIKKYPNFKIFKDLLYPVINLGTLRSAKIPIEILNEISWHIQKYCSEIENFISYTSNKNDWNGTYWNWNTEKLRKYLIDKYKYKWLKNAETKENYNQTSLIFFNKNKSNEHKDISFEKDKNFGYLKIGTKKKRQKIIIPKIETFLIKFHFSKEEMIGRSFSNYYTIRGSEFVFSLLSAFTSYTLNISVLFSKDENFIKSLETAKEDFDKFYLSIKNPYQYSLEALIAKDIRELADKRSKDDK